MSDPVPAITEAAATGETAAIFAGIRQVLGVDVANLIWRHLATMDGALPWAWQALRPLYADGSVIGQATALRRDLALPPMPSSRSYTRRWACSGRTWRPSATSCRPMTTPMGWPWWR
jgi:hypothetical protein